MDGALRKLALTAHVVLAVGWLGAVAAYLALAIVGLTSADVRLAGAAYPALEVIGRFVIVPFALATVAAGLVEALGTRWGLFRHWWVAVKFAMTTLATFVLLRHMQTVSRMSDIAQALPLSSDDHRGLRIQLVVHACGGLLTLLAATVLSIYKPWGLTPYGARKLRERREPPPPRLVASPPAAASVAASSPSQGARWRRIVGVHAIVVLLALLVVHLVRGGVRPH